MASQDMQGGLWDREIENAKLEDALATLENADNKAIAKRMRKAKALVKEVIEAEKLTDGERLRCGGYVVEGKGRSGGGIEVPMWSKVTAGKIKAL